MIEPELTAHDLARLEARGLTADEAQRQLTLLRSPPTPHPVVRPCTLGDGIGQLMDADHPALLERWRAAAAAGRIRKFVPASGAATRMFAAVVSAPGEPTTAAAREIHARRADFAFAESLTAAVWENEDSVDATVRALVSRAGLGLGQLPKALIQFHAYSDGPRTALVEHLVEAAGYVTADQQAIRVHFTVTDTHREPIAALVEREREALEARFGAHLEVDFSVQDPASDTLAIADDGSPFRTESGELMLRPAGHGALLGNLQGLADRGCGSKGSAGSGDLVVVKNIDNIQPEGRQPLVILWKRLLIGHLLQLEDELAALRARLQSSGSGAVTGAHELAALLGLEVTGPDVVAWAGERLQRPTRVCGMVRNTGEPGGGPFWVEGETEAATPQIVEAAQIDLSSPEQAAAWRQATHFNPVDLVCSMRDGAGRPYELAQFVDPKTAFVSRKEGTGRSLRALERPGLWNGAMAGWNTFFVEVPAATFAPVKTVLDLLRPEHQPGPD